MKQHKSIGLKIKERRQSLGISQKDLADRVGIKQPSLSSIEAGRTTPRDATLYALARELQDEFGSDVVLAYLARRGSSSWDQILRPVLQLIEENDLYLDLVVYRLARVSERFAKMVRSEDLVEVAARAENLIELLARPMNDVGPMKKADMIIVPHFGTVDGGEMEHEEESKRKTG